MLDTSTKLALATCVQRPLVALRRVAGLPPTLVTRRSGITWSLDLNEGIDFSIWLLGAFERRTLAAYTQLVAPGSIVFDIGANIGAHTLPLARLVGPSGVVHAFEPVAWALGKLKASLALNRQLLPRVIAHQALLSDREGVAVPSAIYASWPLKATPDTHPTLRACARPTDGARSTTLDAVAAETGLERLDLIKLDVDGGECQVLRGGMKTIRRFHPALIVELSSYVLEEAGDSLDGLLDLLEQAGYDLFDIARRSRLPDDRRSLKKLVPPGGGINALGLPRRSTTRP